MQERLRPGEMRYLVEVLRPVEVQDEFGEQSIDWDNATVFAIVYCRIEQLQGRELDLARSFAATVSHKITTYFLAGLDPTMRLRYVPHSGPVQFFNINAVTNPLGTNRFSLLYCTEVQVL